VSVQPPTLLEVRHIFQYYTKLPAASLGIIHYVNSAGKYTGGGGYHAGNDLLRMIGKQDSDYSKRESDRDRPGSDYGSAIDIGRFRVTLPNGRVVTNHDLTRWVLAEIAAGAPDTHWIREIIYSLDDRTVRRYDRLGIRSSGDDSHLSHEHYSSFRDDVLSPHIPALFRRFWATMEGKIAPPDAPPTTTENRQQGEEEDMLITFVYATVNNQTRWGMGVVSGGEKFWFEANDQARANGYSVAQGRNAQQVSGAKFEEERANFVTQA
jgi:hypothetical protein